MRILLLLPALPLLFALGSLISLNSLEVFSESSRLLTLAGNSFSLILLTLGMTLPPGLLLAMVLFRSNLPGCSPLRGLLLPMMFLPPEVTAIAWQSVWSFAGSGVVWVTGLIPAAAIHSLIALPWVIFLIGHGLHSPGREVEESALMIVSPVQVLRRIVLPRARSGIVLAILWIVVQTSGEISITDQMNVRTLAGEVYTQFVLAQDNMPRSVAVSLPMMGVLMVLVLLWLRKSPPGDFLDLRPPQPLLSFGRRRIAGITLLVIVFLLFGLPLLALIFQAGSARSLDSFTLLKLLEALKSVGWTRGQLLVESLFWCLLAGVVTTIFAGILSISAIETRRFRFLLILVMTGLLAMPGPVLGYSLKELFALLMDLEGFAHLPGRPIRWVLYDEPNGIPVLLTHVCRYLPFAWAMLWPALQNVPLELRENLRCVGASPRQSVRILWWPVLGRSAGIAVLAVAAFSAGELSSSRMVQIPGQETFAQEVFQQLHYGVSSNLAALSLWHLGLVSLMIILQRIFVSQHFGFYHGPRFR